MKCDILIVGCGVSGLYCALNLPRDKNVIIITKSEAEESDSFLAQGGICVLRDEDDYGAFFDDTLRAGHGENKKSSVDIMIKGSREVINDLIAYGVDFERDEDGELLYTKEGAHSRARILYHKDQTGKEITSKLLSAVRALKNVTLFEKTAMVDLLIEDNEVKGTVCRAGTGEYFPIEANYTVLATGGVGGAFRHSTNFPHLTGDSIALAMKYGIELENIDYVQIHPTTLYVGRGGDRKFLISESVRGEGAILLNKNGERFVDELLPRDVVANAIFEEMKKDDATNVYLSMERIPKEEIVHHFEHIYKHCLKVGFDVTKEPIPVVPAQHYFMGGVKVDSNSKTSLERLYAVGETACNGVHGKNRLASNSLLESLVFAKRAARAVTDGYSEASPMSKIAINAENYTNFEAENRINVRAAIEEEKKKR
ncbi:MAG: L-aspartate oxidase [Clostridia bacterium]|nr:L-aspartate oxidase [Clostridia bacterium]